MEKQISTTFEYSKGKKTNILQNQIQKCDANSRTNMGNVCLVNLHILTISRITNEWMTSVMSKLTKKTLLDSSGISENNIC